MKSTSRPKIKRLKSTRQEHSPLLYCTLRALIHEHTNTHTRTHTHTHMHTRTRTHAHTHTHRHTQTHTHTHKHTHTDTHTHTHTHTDRHTHTASYLLLFLINHNLPLSLSLPQQDQELWLSMVVRNIAKCGKFLQRPYHPGLHQGPSGRPHPVWSPLNLRRPIPSEVHENFIYCKRSEPRSEIYSIPISVYIFIYFLIYIYLSIHTAFWSCGGPRLSMTSSRNAQM